MIGAKNDLRHINPHLHKLKFKCEDVDTAVLLLNPGDFLFTFDIKSAYHHVEIFKDHQTYLGFQWFYDGKLQYFIFRVLPFGLSTAPLVFTKILKPVLRHWRSSGKRVCMFLDDGLGGSSSLQSATSVSQAVRRDLIQLGFLLSESKCFWEPLQIQTWLEQIFNMSINQLFVTETRLQKLEQSLDNILGSPKKVTAQQLAAVAGQIVSMSRAIGPKVYLHTRHIYFAIETREHWGSILQFDSKLTTELRFWVRNVRELNGRNMFTEPQHFDTMVYSDASEQGYGGYAISNQQTLVCQGHWLEGDRGRSSTWRELKAIQNMLLAIGKNLCNHRVQWYTDNQNIIRILDRGSRKQDLQSLVEAVIESSNKWDIQVSPIWVPREENQIADYLSKLQDGNDWGIHPHIFNWLDSMWGPFTIDRFATCYNTKCARFNSRFWNPNCEGVDTYSINWAAENNWVVPPPNQIIKAWKHFHISRARGVLIVPLWRGSTFWPSICPDGTHLAKCVTAWAGIPEWNHPAKVPGRFHNTIFNGNFLPFRLIALYIDWQSGQKMTSDRGFCMTPAGMCTECI